jgi:hypothetical protein
MRSLTFISSYWRAPERFVSEDDLPRGDRGKIKWRELEALLAKATTASQSAP